MTRRTAAATSALLALLALLVAPSASATAGTSYPVSYNFLQNALVNGSRTNAPSENDWNCKPTAAHPRPVVLVHGTGGNQATNWGTYAALLANHGYCVFALTYGLSPDLPPQPAIGGMADIRSSARQLKAFVGTVLARTGAHRVDLVGHSQGTLMPDYWVRFLGGAPYVYRYLSLAPLWHGEGTNELGSFTHEVSAYGGGDSAFPVCTACGQMSNGSDFMHKVRSGSGVAATGVHYVNIVTKYDDVVFPYTSGIETGHANMTNVVLQNVCANDYSDHLEVASSPNAARIILNRLDPAHAVNVQCRLTLPANGFVTP